MKRLTYFIMRQQLLGTLLVLAAICAFDSVVDFITEAGGIGETHTLADILQYIVLYMPYRVNEFMPAAVLVGTIVSLGALSANLEMTALRAIGYSKLAILMPALGVAAILAVIVIANAQWVIPPTLRVADAIQSQEIATPTVGRFWLRDNNLFITAIHTDTNQYRDAAIHELSDSGELTRILHADTMLVGATTFMLANARQSILGEEDVRLMTADHIEIKRTPIPLEVMLKNPEAEKMNAEELYEYIQFARASRLNSDLYELALWRHLSHPLSVMILLLLAMPFVFSVDRQAGLGKRLFLGIMLGLICFILNRALSSFILIQQWPTWFAVFLPLTILLSIGLWRLYHCR